MKKPTSKASRRTVTRRAGGLVGNRRFMNAVTGSIDPVIAKTSKKKNSHRGPKVGSVLNTTAINPIQPTMARKNAVNAKSLTGGEV